MGAATALEAVECKLVRVRVPLSALGERRMRFCWGTDVHLDHATTKQNVDFYREIGLRNSDGLFLTGDIAEAPTVIDYIERMSAAIGSIRATDQHEGGFTRIPIFFVLGNHDFYHGSFENVRQRVSERLGPKHNAHYLHQRHTMRLNDRWAIAGVDGNADARHGLFNGRRTSERVWLNDFNYIAEYRGLSRDSVRKMMEELGDVAAKRGKKLIEEAWHQGYANLVFLTHVPPFRDAATYNGKPSDENYTPFFTCKAMGDMMIETMAGYPDRKLLVLCGHSHGKSTIQPAPNIEVRTGGAMYGKPELQEDVVLE